MIGEVIIRFDVLNSTNIKLEEMLKFARLQDGTTVVANFQEYGKGQEGNFWESEKGKNIMFSTLLKPSFLIPEEQFLLNKIVSLGVAEFVKDQIPDEIVKIKWPNDVYVGDKKIAGILINNAIKGSTLEHSIVGIGVNINQKQFLSDAPNPVSLRQVLNRELGLEELLNELFKSLNFWYRVLKNHRTDVIDSKYNSMFYRLGEYHNYRIKGHLINAKITGLSEYGQLLLEDRNYKKYQCDLKEIEFII